MTDKTIQVPDDVNDPNMSRTLKNPYLTPKDTVEGWRERKQELWNHINFRSVAVTQQDFDEAEKGIESFIDTELDLTLTKERARASIIMKNVLHDASQKFESSINRAALSDAQKRITDV